VKMFIGEEIPGLLDAVMRVLPSGRDGVMEDKDGNLGHSAVIFASDRWHGLRVTIEQVLASVEAEGFTGPRVANHVAWLCKTDPRVVQRGILKLQREIEQQLEKEDE
jgi:hypothetical protein